MNPLIDLFNFSIVACSCNRFGSLSEDCDKLTGQFKTTKLIIHLIWFQFIGKCRCRAGVTGLKCDQCHNTEWQLTNRGCVPIKTEQFNGNPCQHHQCHYGAICLHNGINAHCTCQLDCPKTNQSSNRIWYVKKTLIDSTQLSNHIHLQCIRRYHTFFNVSLP